MALFYFASPELMAFGILGNLVSFLVYLSPIPTFYRIVKKKSTEGFHSIPYVIALYSAMLMIYYALNKTDNATLLITINSFGIVIETIYISLFIAYAPKKTRVSTIKLVVVLNIVSYVLIVGVTYFFIQPPKREHVLGGINLLLSFIVFVAPLSIIKKVIQTRSVEFMPFWLSFFLSLSAVMWFFYGFLSKDVYVAVPNILGFFFGIIQMVLYAIYKNCASKPVEELKLTEIVKGTPEIYPVNSFPASEDDDTDENKKDEDTKDKKMDASDQV
ncbi:bidirectional sugar transporter SWEET10-like [Apium graveolens]|uniref:bidirectional sugar transporter SWEET10-like n=1 Tax=Apium graveolens TaxID=4045 RepID=UPI003D792FF4